MKYEIRGTVELGDCSIYFCTYRVSPKWEEAEREVIIAMLFLQGNAHCTG
jgi:hypothetical protein